MECPVRRGAWRRRVGRAREPAYRTRQSLPPAVAGAARQTIADLIRASPEARCESYRPVVIHADDAAWLSGIEPPRSCTTAWTLSAFAGADPALRGRESALLASADLVFTGGRRLYEAKRDRHPSVHCFPSSVDMAHYVKAREWRDEQPDQAAIPRPRLGYFGVIDERFDVALIHCMATPRRLPVRDDRPSEERPRTLRICRTSLPRSSRTRASAYIATWRRLIPSLERGDALHQPRRFRDMPPAHRRVDLYRNSVSPTVSSAGPPRGRHSRGAAGA